MSIPTHRAIVELLANHPGWREDDAGEAGINRARSIAASRWWRNTTEDCFLMVDADIVFTPQDALQIAALCRDGHDVIGAAYPFRELNGVSVRSLPGESQIAFGPGAPPHEVRHIATGFFAVHRRVLAAMIQTLPLCHSKQPWAFWPFFDYRVVPDDDGENNYLSEDYYFCDLARSLGFKVWLERSIMLKHLAQVAVTLGNMQALSAAAST